MAASDVVSRWNIAIGLRWVHYLSVDSTLVKNTIEYQPDSDVATSQHANGSNRRFLS